jgi:hypothetical protein
MKTEINKRKETNNNNNNKHIQTINTEVGKHKTHIWKNRNI